MAEKSEFAEQELAATMASKYKIVTVVDPDGRVWCHVRMLDVFETTFGHPDPRLVRGGGDGDDVEKFKHDHRGVWADEMAAAGHPLTDETVLIVEEFVLVEGAEKPQSLNTSKLIMRPERVSEEHLDPFQGPAGLPI